MTTSSQSTDSPTQTTTTSTGYDTPPPADPAPPADPIKDMYDTPPADPTPSDDPAPSDAPKDNATGYGDDPAPSDPPKEDPAPADPPKDDPAPTEEELKDAEKLLKFEIKESLGNLPEGLDKESIEAFVLENKMTKEQVDAYVKFAQAESDQQATNLEEARKQQKVDWTNELKNDETFGGDNFNINIDRAEKMLGDHLPNLKKALTERGSMLPPYIMKDLANLYKTLNPTTTLVNGDPSIPAPKDDGNFLETMYE